MLCLVRPAAEEHEVVRRMGTYRRRNDRPGTGSGMRAPDQSRRASLAHEGRSA